MTHAEMEEGTSKIQQMAPPPMGEQEISIKEVAHGGLHSHPRGVERVHPR